MTLKRLLLVFGCMLFGSISAQTTTAFRMNYNVALMDIPANAIESQTLGNYVFAGTNVNFLPIVGTVTELSNSGSVLWSKQYSGGLSYQLNDIKKDGASGYYMGGGSSTSSGVFLRIDNTGNYVDGNKFDLTNATGEYLSRVIKTSDGGYVAAGYSYGYDPDGAGALPKNDSTTALVVKFDANGNHLWHHVLRFYSDAGKTNPILNDGSFVDVVEVSDGYIFVGSYEVDDVININSDGDDMTPNDAMILKTTTAGAITYLKQIDAPSTTSSNPSRDFTSITKTAAGLPLISGSDGTGRPLLLMRLLGSGGWAVPTWIRKYGATQFFGVYDPMVPSRFFETNDGNYAVMGTYIVPLGDWSQFLMKIDPATYTPAWTKKYTFSLAVILPQGGQVSDNGYLSLSTVMSGMGFDYHVVKTDPNGVTPTACPEGTVSPSNATVSYTWADPFYNDFNANAFDNSNITPTITAITPTSSIQCQTIVSPCTPPAAATTVTATPATICAGASTSITASGPASNVTYNVYTASTGGTNLGAAPLSVSPATTTTYYVETVDNTNPSCVSVTRTAVTVTVNPAPTAPVIGTITQPTCTVSTGSVALSGLPSSGTWTVTASPGGATITGTGTTGTFTGLAPGTYTFTVASAGGTTNLYSENFETGGPGWTLNVPVAAEGADPNFFQIDADEGGVAPPGCGVAGNGDETLHITSVFNPAGGAAYDAGGLCGLLFCPETHRRAESPVISTVGQSGLTLNFNYIAKGNIPTDQATVWYFNGTWNQLGTALTSVICGSLQGQWTAYSAALPASCNNIANFKMAIRWDNNDDGVGTDPSVAINNIVITAAGSGCSSPASASAIINAAPTTPTVPVIGTITQPTCTVSTGSVALSGLPASGTWTVTASPGGTTTTGTGTTTTFSGLAAGATYTFTVTNAGGCTSTASANAVLSAAPTAATAPVIGTITQPTCTVSTGSVALSGLPASGSWTITTTPGGTTTTGSGTTTTLSGLTAGATYTFTVTNASGCTSPSSANAVLNAAPTAPTAPVIGTITQPTCTVATGSVALSGLPSSGTWTVTASPGGTTTTGTGTITTFSGLAAGATYTFTVTNAAGCTSTASSNAVIGTAPGAPTVPVIGTITQPTCSVAAGSVALSGLPSSGTWTVTTTPGGATSTGTGTTTTINSLTAGTTYTFTVTNSLGCSSTTSANAILNAAPSIPTAPIVGTITQPTCSVSTGSVDLSGLPASGTWTITTAPGGATSTGTGTTTTISGLTAGTTYTFTVTNAAGCISVVSTNAAVSTAPSAPAAPIVGAITQPTCSVATGSVALSGLPSSGTWTVTASPGALTTTGTGTTTTFSGLIAGTTYTFTVTNAAGCTSTVSTNAVISAQPATPTSPIVGTITQPTCANPLGSVALSGLPSTGTWTITGTPGGTTTSGTGATTTITGLTAGTTYTFTVTNAAGCTSSASTNAVINTLPATPADPTASVSTQPTCAAPTGTITITAPTGANYQYSIDGTNYQAGTTFSGLTPGNYNVTVQDQTTGCVSTGVVALTVNTVAGAPVINVLTQEDVTCFGDTDGSASVQVSGGSSPYTYAWSPSGGSGDIATGLSAGTYTVTVTDNVGCSSVQTIVIGAPSLLVVGGVETNVSCTSSTAGSITTNATGGSGSYTYDWTPNSETTASLTGLAAGSYGVTVTDANGCTATESYTIITSGSLPVSVTPTYSEIDAGESVVLTATGGGNYIWTPSTGLSCDTCDVTTASPTSTTTYIVTVSDDNGCFGQDTAIVKVNIMCGEFFVPNIFSPNGTGPAANNKLCVYGTPACVAELNFAIYNRWGEKVFETTDITQCWDGMYKDKLMNSGIFVYKLNATLIDGTNIEQSGNITLVH